MSSTWVPISTQNTHQLFTFQRNNLKTFSFRPHQRTLRFSTRTISKLSLLDTAVMGDTMINVNAVYKIANAPIEARIKDLMSRMSVKEKLGQMTQIERAVATPDVIKDLCIAPIGIRATLHS
ncbi:glycosyl hydrolase family protein [Artemisia annua]|uniref:Glycosyl hydrolase family protein n=1 Tax=Artemisia annua TaxID=35608 RepID=A0A2U1KB17_ARTAN|nr:glycosyl hydrolase family protein [Artemisia annua]